MRAYRIEHYLGLGPVAAGLAQIHYHHALDAIQRGIELPTPEDEHISVRSQVDGLQHLASDHHIFACDSLKQLRLWFPSRLGCEAMGREGAVLRAFAVKEADAVCAPTRMIFDRRAASLLWTVPATQLHSLTDEAGMAA